MKSGQSATIPPPQTKQLNVFERFLTLWVGLCLALGIVLGKLLPGAIASLRRMEFGSGSQINGPIAILVWLMIIPMMMKVDFGSIRRVGQRPRGLVITLFVNWVVKPFSMALLAWLFFRHVFASLLMVDEAIAIHRRLRHFRRRTPHRDGVCMELFDGRGRGLRAGPGFGE